MHAGCPAAHLCALWKRLWFSRKTKQSSPSRHLLCSCQACAPRWQQARARAPPWCLFRGPADLSTPGPPGPGCWVCTQEGAKGKGLEPEVPESRGLEPQDSPLRASAPGQAGVSDTFSKSLRNSVTRHPEGPGQSQCQPVFPGKWP